MKNTTLLKYFVPLTNLHDIHRTRRGVELHADGEIIALDFIHADVLRIKVSQGGRLDPQPTFAVVSDEFDVPAFSLRKAKTKLTLATDAIRAVVDLQTFSLDLFRPDGSVIFRSVPQWGYRFLNDSWLVRRAASPRDAALGLGQKTGPLNHRGRSLQQWNCDILASEGDGIKRNLDALPAASDPKSDQFDPYYMSINLLYHLPADANGQAWASYIDNGYRLHYDLSADDCIQVRADGGQLTEYIFAGPAIPQILSRYCQLTGRMDAPPLWALGHHQCRWHRYTQQEWLALADTYRKKAIPCDTLWLDIDYMDAYRVFSTDKKLFPDMPAALKRLRKNGFRAITIIDPGVKHEPGYNIFDEAAQRDLLCRTQEGNVYIGQVWPGRTAFPDFVKPQARDWWGQLNAQHVQAGFAGIWNDMNEPATGEVSPNDMRFDNGRAPHHRYHNQYAMLMAMGTRTGLKQAMPELRTFILSRAGFAGIQRYAANWTGDNCSTWQHLAMSIPMNCNLSLSGQPFVGSDIGGFLGDCPDELLVRWYQYGAFQPFMRNHCIAGCAEQYPWTRTPQVEQHVRQAVELRYRLLPYVYTAFMECANGGLPIQRPLVYDYQADPDARDNSTEFLFGPHLLVAPVVTEGATTRTLYLPKGWWYDFHTGQLLRGGRQITVDAPLDRCPIFVRAGAVIPTAPLVQTTMAYAPTQLTLTAYVPPKTGRAGSILYEDDGLSDRHRSGEFLRTQMTLARKGNRLTLKGTVQGDGYPQFARRRLRVQFVGARLHPQTFANRGEPFEKAFTLPD